MISRENGLIMELTTHLSRLRTPRVSSAASLNAYKCLEVLCFALGYRFSPFQVKLSEENRFQKALLIPKL